MGHDASTLNIHERSHKKGDILDDSRLSDYSSLLDYRSSILDYSRLSDYSSLLDYSNILYYRNILNCSGLLDYSSFNVGHSRTSPEGRRRKPRYLSSVAPFLSQQSKVPYPSNDGRHNSHPLHDRGRAVGQKLGIRVDLDYAYFRRCHSRHT